MFITIDSNNNILRANCPIKMDDSQIEVNEWPIDENGNPVSKQLCVWDEADEIVVLKSQEQLDSENALKQLSETDNKMTRVTEDLISILITKNVIRKEELPVSVQELYGNKKILRSKLI